MSSILQLIPFSETGHVHGGKIRVAEIGRILDDLGAKVERFYCGDLSFIEEGLPECLISVPNELIGDVKCLYRDYGISKLSNSEYSIIVFEHPWLWPEVQKIKKVNPNATVVYSSHNIEHKLKSRILERYINAIEMRKIERLILDVEQKIAKEVNIIIAVSEEDAEWYIKNGNAEVIVAQNGTNLTINEVPTTEDDFNPYAIVVGSAHPPNIEGCLQYLGDSDLWLPKYTRIKIVGTLAEALRPSFLNLKNRWGLSCIDLISNVTNEQLKELIEHSSAVLLPISYGGGTNLKTAEALASGRAIVASSSAMRGYEEYWNSEGLFVADSKLDFKIKTIACLLKEPQRIFQRDISKLSWESRFENLRDRLKEI